VRERVNLPYGIWRRVGDSQAEFRRNRPNKKLKLGPKIYVFPCTLYVCNNIIKGVLDIPNSAWVAFPFSSLVHTLYHSHGQSKFIHAPIKHLDESSCHVNYVSKVLSTAM
jgi:hypothetical protein